MRALNNSHNSVTVTVTGFSMGRRTYTGDLMGRFAGDNAEALLTRFEIDQNSGADTLTGVQVVEPAS